MAAQAWALEFDVASVKQNKSGGNQVNSNVPLGPGDVYTPTGGFFKATNVPLILYIAFAYKLMANDVQSLSQLPEWTKTDRFDIQAKVEGNPTKDQMRLLMRSVLTDRFKFAMHNETRQLPVFALVPIKPGATGPQLRPHPADSSCSTAAPAQPAPGSVPAPLATVAGGFPAICGGIFGMPASAPGRFVSAHET